MMVYAWESVYACIMEKVPKKEIRQNIIMICAGDLKMFSLLVNQFSVFHQPFKDKNHTYWKYYTNVEMYTPHDTCRRVTNVGIRKRLCKQVLRFSSMYMAISVFLLAQVINIKHFHIHFNC